MPLTVTAILALYLVLWQGYKVRTRVSSFGQLALVGTLIFVLSVPIFARLRGTQLVDDLDPRWIKLIGGLLVLLACLSVYLFRLSIEEQGVRRPRVARAVLSAVAVAAYLTGLVAYFVHQGTALPPVLQGSDGPLVASYFVVGSGYYALVLYAVSFWMFRVSTGLDKHLTIGLRIAAVGLTIIATQSFSRALPALLVMLDGPSINPRGFLPGIASSLAAPLFFGGLSYPLIASRIRAFRRWRLQRAKYTSLHSLWDTVSTVYPELVLPQDRRESRLNNFTQSVLHIDFKYHRRIAECCDGLYRLRSYAPEDMSPEQREAANALLSAVALHEKRHPHSPTPWGTVGGGGGDDVDLLMQLSDALESVRKCGKTPAVDAGVRAGEGPS